MPPKVSHHNSSNSNSVTAYLQETGLFDFPLRVYRGTSHPRTLRRAQGAQPYRLAVGSAHPHFEHQSRLLQSKSRLANDDVDDDEYR